MATRLDRIEGSGLYRSSSFIRARRTAFVSDLPTTAPANVLLLAALSVGVPQLGDAHPGIPGCNVVSHDVEPRGDDQCLVYITYAPPPVTRGVS